MLSKKALSEFKEIYKEEFKKELPDDEVAKKANDLINLFRILIQSSNIVRPEGLINKKKKLA